VFECTQSLIGDAYFDRVAACGIESREPARHR
jgi:hypothetical protein